MIICPQDWTVEDVHQDRSDVVASFESLESEHDDIFVVRLNMGKGYTLAFKGPTPDQLLIAYKAHRKGDSPFSIASNLAVNCLVYPTNTAGDPDLELLKKLFNKYPGSFPNQIQDGLTTISTGIQGKK